MGVNLWLVCTGILVLFGWSATNTIGDLKQVARKIQQPKGFLKNTWEVKNQYSYERANSCGIAVGGRARNIGAGLMSEIPPDAGAATRIGFVSETDRGHGMQVTDGFLAEGARSSSIIFDGKPENMAGMQTVNGSVALKSMRSRNSDDMRTNLYGHKERQESEAGKNRKIDIHSPWQLFWEALTEKTVDKDIGFVLLEVATRLRSGVSVENAWRQTLVRAGLVQMEQSAGTVGTNVTPLLDEYGVPCVFYAIAPDTRKEKLKKLWASRDGKWRPPLVNSLTYAALPGAIAACRITHEVGAPLADILDACARGITEAAEASAARKVALAAPVASTRMLQIIPLVGMGLAMMLGVSPIQTFTNGLLGGACAVGGFGFLVMGHLWVRRLTKG